MFGSYHSLDLVLKELENLRNVFALLRLYKGKEIDLLNALISKFKSNLQIQFLFSGLRNSDHSIFPSISK